MTNYSNSDNSPQRDAQPAYRAAFPDERSLLKYPVYKQKPLGSDSFNSMLSSVPSPESSPTMSMPALSQAKLATPLPQEAASNGFRSWQQSGQFIPSALPVPGSVSKMAPTPQAAFNSSRLSSRNKRRATLLISAFCLLVVLSTLGFSLLRHITKGIPDVTLYRVSMQNVDQDIGGGGVVYPNQRLDISYPFASHVLSVFVKPGDKVSVNQSLVQLDLSQTNARNISDLNAQVEQAYSDMLAAQAYLNSVSGTGNPIVIAQATQSYSAAQSRYNALAAEAAAPSLHQGKIDSPISGIVTAVNVYPGQIFSAGKVMLTIFDESSVIVRVEVPLSNYREVHINQPVQVTPSALLGHSYNGNVISIIPSSNPQTGTFEVWVNVVNRSGDLLPGMSAFVRLQNRINALVVPRLAVLNPDRDSTVFVVRQQRTHIQHVQILGYAGDTILIGSGLAVNDTIVLVGLDALQNNQEVHITGIEGQPQ